MVGRVGWPVTQIAEEVREPRVAFLGQIAECRGDRLQHLVVCGRIRKRRGHPFMTDRAYDHETHLVLASGNLLDGVHELGHVALERTHCIQPVERVGHAVTQDNHRWFDLGDLVLQPGEYFFRLAEIEAGSARAARGVGAPSQIADDELAVLEPLMEAQFDVAVFLFALDQRVPEKEDTVAIDDVEAVGVLGGRRQGSQCGANDREGNSWKHGRFGHGTGIEITWVCR